MLVRTWPYGTKLQAKVLRRDEAHHQGRPVAILTLVDERQEGHILVGTRSDDGQPGDEGTITFHRGGPLGGYWKFQKAVSPESTRPAL